MTPAELHIVHGCLLIAGVCALLIAVLLPLHIRREKRRAQELAARLNARITMEQHWAHQQADGRTLMIDGEALRRVWRLQSRL